jgi:hypothetical protein
MVGPLPTHREIGGGGQTLTASAWLKHSRTPCRPITRIIDGVQCVRLRRVMKSLRKRRQRLTNQGDLYGGFSMPRKFDLEVSDGGDQAVRS